MSVNASQATEETRPSAREEARDARRAIYRNRVVEAAADVFAARGVAETRMEDLAQAAGISLGTLYSVYTGKAEIVDAVHARRLQEIHTASVLAEDAGANALDAVLAGGRAYLAYFMDHPDYLRMYIEEGSSWGVRSTMTRGQHRGRVWNDGVRALAELFATGIRDGLFEPGAPDRMARTMLAMQQVALADWIEDGMAAERDTVLEDAETLIRRAFCTPAWRQCELRAPSSREDTQ